MHKYSVIIPTMWMGKELQSMLKVYEDSPYIGEVIIIDNAPGNEIGLSAFSKVRSITKGMNIFVNPAWNWGVKLAKFSKIIIANDDIFIPAEKLNDLLKLLDSQFTKRTLVGPNYKDIEGDLSIVRPRSRRGFGTFMIMNKDSYVPIPEDLKLWRGDFIQYLSHDVYCVNGLGIQTEMSTTLKMTDTMDLAKRDCIVWKKHMRKYYDSVSWLKLEDLQKLSGKYWKNPAGRFKYINVAIDELKKYYPESILELGPGPGGIRLCNLATTVDINGDADITMDITNTPWGLGKYDAIVALQVFEHLEGKQKKTFLQAYRAARKCLIISIPYKWKKGRQDHIGLDNKTMLKWCKGHKWSKAIDVGSRRIYIWKI